MEEPKPWYADLNAEEMARLFPGGQADIDAFLARQKWREEYLNFPRTIDDPGVLDEAAKIMLESDERAA